MDVIKIEGDIGVCGVGVLGCCCISVDKILPCGIAEISNPHGVRCLFFKPMVVGETKLFAVLGYLFDHFQN